MRDVSEQTCSPCATCDTMLLPDKHYLFASDAVTDRDVTKEARGNNDHIVLEAVRSAGHYSDDKDLDWRTTNAMARLQRQCRRRNDRHRAFTLSSTQLGEKEFSAGLIPATMSESSWNTKRRKEQCYRKTFVPFLCT